jgi:hypothetical protein
MAITVSGTTITFNDATTQTTAAGAAPTAGNGITVTSGTIALGVPSNSSVGTYTAAYATVSAGVAGPDYTIGTTIAGSSLNTAAGSISGQTVYFTFDVQDNFASLSSAGLSGTWKAVARVKSLRDIGCASFIMSGMWIRTA